MSFNFLILTAVLRQIHKQFLLSQNKYYETTITLLFFIPFISFSQVPQGVGYQGVATDANGIELVNQAISIRASVLSGSAQEQLNGKKLTLPSTDTFGLFTLTIGQGTNTTNGAQTSFADISWGTNTHYFKNRDGCNRRK